MKEIEKVSGYSIPSDHASKHTSTVINILVSKINEIVTHLNQANGETPEVDNTVGQKLIEDYILCILRGHTKEAFPKNSIDEAKLLGYIMYIFNQFKPVETDKEEPFTSNELNTLIESVTLNPRLQRDCAIRLQNKLIKLHKGS